MKYINWSNVVDFSAHKALVLFFRKKRKPKDYDLLVTSETDMGMFFKLATPAYEDEESEEPANERNTFMSAV